MAEHKKHYREPAAPGSPEGAGSERPAQHTIVQFIEKFHSSKTLNLCAGICQLFLGMTVVIIAVQGLIRPIWLSTLLSIVASIAVLTGIYFSYLAIAECSGDTLLRNAMRRIAKDQN
jgi:hypothetical protein